VTLFSSTASKFITVQFFSTS